MKYSHFSWLVSDLVASFARVLKIRTSIYFVLIGILVVVGGASVLPLVDIEDDINAIFKSSRSDLVELENVQSSFSNVEIPLLFMVKCKTPLSSKKDFEQMSDLQKRIRLLAEVDSVASILDVKVPKVVSNSLFMKPLVNLGSNKFKSKYLDKLDDYSDITPLFLNNSKTSFILHIYPKAGFSNDLKGELYECANASGYYNLEVLGADVLAHEVKSKIDNDIFRLAVIGFCFIIITFWFFFRSFSVVVFVGVMVTINVSASILFIWLLGVGFNIMTAIVPTMIAILSVTDLNHIMHVYFHGDQQSEKQDRIEYTYSKLKYSLILTSVTTAIGFSIFLISDIWPIIYFGLISILSIGFALFTSWYIAPSIIILLPNKGVKLMNHFYLSEWLKNALLGQNKLIISIFFVLLAVLGFNTYSSWDINYIVYDDMEKEESLYSNYEYFNKEFTGTRNVEIYFTGESLMPYDSAMVTLLEKTESLLLNKYNFGFVSGPQSIHKMYNRAMNKGQVDHYLIDYRKLNEGWRTVEKHYDVSVFSNEKKDALRIFGSTKEEMASLNLHQISAIQDDLNELSKQLGVSAIVGGSTYLRDTSTDVLSKTIIGGIFISIGIVSLIVMLTYKSILIGFIAFLVNVFPVFFSISTLFYFDFHITPSIAMMLSISFGIALDDTIYFLGRLKSENHGLNQRAVFGNVNEITFPVISTSIILSMSFCALFFSSFSFNVINGVIIVLTLLVAMICDLIFLPSLLLLMNRED